MRNIFFIVAAALFASCNEVKQETQVFNSFKEKGDSIVAHTFDTLRNTLTKAIGEHGFTGAIEFCNVNALPLTNTYATENISIKRTSDKLRNPANKADSMEQRILSTYFQLSDNKETLRPITEKDAADRYHYYKPIIIQAMCLNCHGDRNTQIKPDTWQAIQAKYPADAAFNYKDGDLRGIWHVTFHIEKQ